MPAAAPPLQRPPAAEAVEAIADGERAMRTDMLVLVVGIGGNETYDEDAMYRAERLLNLLRNPMPSTDSMTTPTTTPTTMTMSKTSLSPRRTQIELRTRYFATKIGVLEDYVVEHGEGALDTADASKYALTLAPSLAATVLIPVRGCNPNLLRSWASAFAHALRLPTRVTCSQDHNDSDNNNDDDDDNDDDDNAPCVVVLGSSCDRFDNDSNDEEEDDDNGNDDNDMPCCDNTSSERDTCASVGVYDFHPILHHRNNNNKEDDYGGLRAAIASLHAAPWSIIQHQGSTSRTSHLHSLPMNDDDIDDMEDMDDFDDMEDMKDMDNDDALAGLGVSASDVREITALLFGNRGIDRNSVNTFDNSENDDTLDGEDMDIAGVGGETLAALARLRVSAAQQPHEQRRRTAAAAALAIAAALGISDNDSDGDDNNGDDDDDGGDDDVGGGKSGVASATTTRSHHR